MTCRPWRVASSDNAQQQKKPITVRSSLVLLCRKIHASPSLLHPLHDEVMDWETAFGEYLKHLCEADRHSDRCSRLIGYCRRPMLPIRRKSVEPLVPVAASLRIKVEMA